MTERKPRITKTNTDVVEDKAWGYPLKCYVEMRNDSTECVDIRISNFTPSTVTLKKFKIDVLQVKLREWCPTGDGVDHVAVFSGQLFRAWLAPDETKFTKGQIEGLRGKIGRLVLLINGQTWDVDL
jgi:hypothetical protein